jgi:uncharacterized protein (DUF58 family)
MSTMPFTPVPKRAHSGLRQRISDWIFRPLVPEPSPVTLMQRRIFILPSKQGLGYVGVLLLLLVASINYNLSLGYVLTFFLGSVGWVALHATHRNLSRLTLAPGRTEPVFAGEMARFRVELKSPLRPRYAIAMRFSSQDYRGGDVFADAPKDEVATIDLLLKTRHRGPLAAGRLEVYTRYPLGLFHAWSYVDFGQTILVYPCPDASAGPLPTAHGQAADEGIMAPGDEEFAGLRKYQPGDNLRKIAWKALARGQELLTKEFHGYQTGDLWLDYTVTPGHTQEVKLSRLCYWVLEADRLGLSYGLALPAERIAQGAGTRHRERCLQALAQA